MNKSTNNSWEKSLKRVNNIRPDSTWTKDDYDHLATVKNALLKQINAEENTESVTYCGNCRFAYKDCTEIDEPMFRCTHESCCNQRVSNKHCCRYGDSQNTYEVIVYEVLKKVVKIDAASESDAVNKVTQLYNDEKIVLTADDFKDYKITLRKSKD